MRRIVILGCAGSGKSTLARRLGRRLGLPVVHLDRLFWRPGWTWPDITCFRARVAEAIAREAWISDGNYVLTSFDLTVPRADTIILLERPRWLCLFRVLRRSLFRRERPDLPQGCQEKLDWQLISYVWRYRKLGGPRVEAGLLLHAAEVPVIRLRSEREITDFLARWPRPPPSPAG
jgi:adenylate kinase family enzyme